MPNGPVLPHEIPGVLVAHFLKQITRSASEIPEHMSDTFGTDKLGFLIEALASINPLVPVEEWCSVANFVLGKASCRFGFFYYTPTLMSLSPYVSIEVREKIVAHFVAFGEFDRVLHITARQLFRVPNTDEIMTMAQYHRDKWTSSSNDVWSKLSSLVDCGFAANIEALRKEVVEHEQTPDLS